MNPKDVTLLMPDDGEMSLQEMASKLNADINDARNVIKGLEEQWLFTLVGDKVYATEVLRSERENGVLPKYDENKIPVEKRHEAALKSADRLCFKADPQSVLEYATLFGACEAEIRNQFKLKKTEFDAIIRHLGCEGKVGISYARKWGIIKKTEIKVPKTQETSEISKRYSPSIRNDDYRREYKTKIDVIAELTQTFSPLQIGKITRYLDTATETLLPVAIILHDAGLVTVRHKGTKSTLERKDGTYEFNPNDGTPTHRPVDMYTIANGETQVEAYVIEEHGELRYKLRYPTFLPPTNAVLERIYEEANPGAADFGVENRSDFENVKSRLRTNIATTIMKKLPFIDENTQRIMVCELTNELHLGRLEYLLQDPNIEEIKAQSGRPIFIKHIKYGQEWIETNLTLSERSMEKYAKAIARETRQQIDTSHPLMDAVLHTGDRVNCCLPDTAGGEYIIEVRVFSKSPWNFVRLVKKGTVSPEVLAFLWLAIQYKMNILVSGETGSGKTSFVNALSLFLPKNDHIISVEDTREIQLPGFYRNWSHMTTRNGDAEKDVTMSRLLVNALRMNPSFIIMGEVRNRQDIETLMHATAMGHPIMSTIHTRDCSTTIKRFDDAGISTSDLTNIHINVILEAVRSKDDTQPKRRVKEVGEYMISAGKVTPNRIFRLDMNADIISLVNEPQCYYQLVMDKVNMNKDEIRKNLETKVKIIEWLVERDADDIETLGTIIQTYYNDPPRVINAALAKKEIKEVLRYEK